MRLFPVLLASVVAAAAVSGPVQIRDLSGRSLHYFEASGKITVLFFISSDCPISNSYAPEIQRLCQSYGTKGVSCSLLYEDVDITRAAAQKHWEEYRYRGIPAAVDTERKVAKRAAATVTPEAVLVDGAGQIRYRGRIDNFYAALGKPRQHVTVHDLSDALDAVLAGKPVANPQTSALGCDIVDPEIFKK